MGNSVHWLFETQKSPELSALLQLVEENELNGEPKFMQRTCRELGRILVCRAYAPALLELCHLVLIASACGRPRPDQVERFFWDSGPARGNSFRAYMDKQIDQSGWRWEGFTVTADGVRIDTGEIEFTVHFSRMPLLSALMEFLMTTIGYPELNETLQPITGTLPTKKALSDTANKLAKQLYDFLKDHLPTAQEQRKFHRLIDFMAEAQPGGFDYLSIKDPLLLDFWQQASRQPSSDGVDFKTFSNVFGLFVNLRQSLEQVDNLRELSSPRHIGSDREAGEIDPDELLHLLEPVDEPSNPLAELQAPPANRIKFLNQQEQAGAELLAETGPTAQALPQSLLRCEVFEPGRKRLTQALRDKAPLEKRLALIETCAEGDYPARIQAYGKLDKHIENLLFASLYVLLRHGDESTPALALALRPELDLRPLVALLTPSEQNNLVSLSGKVLANQLMAMMEHPESLDAPLAELVREMQKAFKKIARKGFKETEIDQPEIVEGFAQGHPLLVQLRQQIKRFIDRLQNSELDWAAQFQADYKIFTKQFHKLYGEAIETTSPETTE
jgi:hypothetical protein